MLPPNTSFFANSHAGYPELENLPQREHTADDDSPAEPFNLCNFNRHLKIQPKIMEFWMQARGLVARPTPSSLSPSPTLCI
jgi:hypothetical protein